MSAPTLANLPYDVIDRLLVVLPDFDTLAAAIKTCKHIYDTFCHHPKSTMRAVALNITGPALPDAIDLIRWQTSMVHDRDSETVLTQMTYEESNLLLENAATVDYLSRLYSIAYKDARSSTDQLSADEKRRFLTALYRYWRMHFEFTTVVDEDEYDDDDDDADQEPIPHLQDVVGGLAKLSDRELYDLDAVATFMHDAGCWASTQRHRFLPPITSLWSPDQLVASFKEGSMHYFYASGIDRTWIQKALETAYRARRISEDKRATESKKAISGRAPAVQQTCDRCALTNGPTFSGRAYFQLFQDFFANGAMCRKFEDCLARNTTETKSLNDHLQAETFDWAQFYEELCEVETVNAEAPWNKDGLYCLLCLFDLPTPRLRRWWSAKKQELGIPMKDDCWYGWSCRTQTHKSTHAERLNHLCEPTRGTAYHPPATN